MEIAVLIKQVPATTEVAIDSVTNCLIRENAEMTVNPADLNAITTAIRIKEKTGGRISAITMGPPTADKALYTAIAMGVDEGYLVTDRAFGGGDTLGTARVVTEALNYIGTFDLILCGDASSDGATGQTGHMVAEMMGIPCASDARNVDVEGDAFIVLRQWKNRKVKVRLRTPCMITVGVGSNKIILPTLRSQMKANKHDLITITNVQLELNTNEIGSNGAKSVVVETIARVKSSKRAKMIQGDPAEIAAKIKKLLDEEEFNE